ncbi:MFS transporter [Dyella sp.]|uniref:MFS transporter n=1 Tax=Dyella sp. TaxID=1869338 RepID=UPI002ED06B23
MATIWTSRQRAALATICLSSAMLGLEISSVPAILPSLEHALPADFRQLQWIMNAYTLAMSSSLMAWGALADRFGRKRIFMLGIVVFGLASLGCGLAADAAQLIAARAVQGASGAAMLTCQIAVLSHQFREGAQRSAAFAWWGVIFGAGLGLGPLVGAGITVAAGWGWVFLVHAVLALVALVLGRVGLVESSDPEASRVDLPGMVALSLAVFCLVYLVIQGQTIDRGHPFELSLAIVSLTCALGFVVIERHARRPMFDFSVFRIRSFSGALIGSAGMNFSFWPFVIYLPIYFKTVLGLGTVAGGVMLLAYTMPPLVAPPVAERLLARHGAGRVIPLGLFTMGLGFVLMWLATQFADDSWKAFLPGCIVAGCGLGLTNTPVSNTATAAIPVERVGMASGMDTTTRILSLSVNIALMGLILVHGTASSLVTISAPHGCGSPDQLAQLMAAGNMSAGAIACVGDTSSRQALLHGFGAVMGYATCAAWGLSLLGLVVFGQRRKSVSCEASLSAPH